MNKTFKIVIAVLFVALIILGITFVKAENKRISNQFNGWHLVQ